MNIEIKCMDIVNFKCFRNLHLDFHSGTNTIYGQNSAGKSSVFDAFTWLLFGKDSHGNSAFSVKPTGAAPGVMPEVTAVLSVNGETLTLRKTLRERWEKHRGSAEARFAGNTTDYFVDDVPRKESEYKRIIAGYIDENQFKLLTNVYAFARDLHWKERRKLLAEICGLPDDASLLAGAPQFARLAAAAGNRTVDDYKAALLVLKVSDQLNNALLDKEQDLNDKLAAMEQEDRDKQAAEELADYQQKIKEKYDELEKAETSERQAILDEISEPEADWNEKQLEAQRDAEKEKLQAQLDTLEDFKSEYQDALDEIQSSQDSMADKLMDYGDLFTTVQSGTREFIQLGDLEKDIEAINRYGEALENLKARGVSDSLLDEITGLSVDEATEYTEKLLAMTDDQYNEYMALWEQKQQAAQQVAAQFYSSEIEALGREFVDKIPEELGEVKDEMSDIGVQGVQGMISGMLSQTGALFSAARTIITGAMDAMRDEADIHSPSKKTANLVGVPLAQGVGVGFDKAYPNVMAKLKNAFAASMAQTSARIRTMADNPAAYGTRTQRIVQTINRNTTNTTRVVPDGRGIFTLVEEESRRRGKSMISGKGLVT